MVSNTNSPDSELISVLVPWIEKEVKEVEDLGSLTEDDVKEDEDLV